MNAVYTQYSQPVSYPCVSPQQQDLRGSSHSTASQRKPVWRRPCQGKAPVRCPLGGDGEGRGGDGAERLSLVAERSSLGWRVPRPGGKGPPRRRPEVLGSAWGLGSHHALGAMGPPPATPRVISGRVFRLHPTSLSPHSCRFLASVPSPCP